MTCLRFEVPWGGGARRWSKADVGSITISCLHFGFTKMVKACPLPSRNYSLMEQTGMCTQIATSNLLLSWSTLVSVFEVRNSREQIQSVCPTLPTTLPMVGIANQSSPRIRIWLQNLLQQSIQVTMPNWLRQEGIFGYSWVLDKNLCFLFLFFFKKRKQVQRREWLLCIIMAHEHLKFL